MFDHDCNCGFVSTGDPKKDRHIALLRHSGNAFWIILGMIMLNASLRWAGNTQLGHMVKTPIINAGNRALDGAYELFRTRTWKIGPALIAAAGLLKQRSTGKPLSSRAESELGAIAERMPPVTMQSGIPTINVNASDLLAVAKILKSETGLTGSLTDELSIEQISQLLDTFSMSSDVRWRVVVDKAAECNAELRISRNGRAYGEKLNELIRTNIGEAIEFGCAMLALHDHAGDVYDDQADTERYIATLDRKTASRLPGSSQPDTGASISDSFLQNLKNVLAITDDADVVRSAMLDEAALKDIAAGHIRTELKLRETLRRSSDQPTRVRSR